jgi:hypothetical protein
MKLLILSHADALVYLYDRKAPLTSTTARAIQTIWGLPSSGSYFLTTFDVLAITALLDGNEHVTIDNSMHMQLATVEQEMHTTPETILDVDHKRYAKPVTDNKRCFDMCFALFVALFCWGTAGSALPRDVNDSHLDCTTLAHVSWSQKH